MDNKTENVWRLGKDRREGEKVTDVLENSSYLVHKLYIDKEFNSKEYRSGTIEFKLLSRNRDAGGLCGFMNTEGTVFTGISIIGCTWSNGTKLHANNT